MSGLAHSGLQLERCSAVPLNPISVSTLYTYYMSIKTVSAQLLAYSYAPHHAVLGCTVRT